MCRPLETGNGWMGLGLPPYLFSFSRLVVAATWSSSHGVCTYACGLVSRTGRTLQPP